MTTSRQQETIATLLRTRYPNNTPSQAAMRLLGEVYRWADENHLTLPVRPVPPDRLKADLTLIERTVKGALKAYKERTTA
jgi:hypothetical protein